jgi:hypothetical protein
MIELVFIGLKFNRIERAVVLSRCTEAIQSFVMSMEMSMYWTCAYSNTRAAFYAFLCIFA